MGERDISRLPFTRELKRLGFRRDGPERDPLFYVKDISGREIDVQLWRDGGHRASHALVHPENGARRQWCTYPTGFKTVAEMLAAIEHEQSRADHPPGSGWPDVGSASLSGETNEG